MTEQPILNKLFAKGKVFTLSNLLSLSRIPGSVIIYYAAIDKQVELTLLLVFIFGLTDYADGYFARKYNQVSELGKVLDPLSDKFCAGFAFLALYQAYGMPFWILAIVVGRDILILIASVFLATRLPYITASAMPGKIAVNVLAFLFILYVLAERFPILESSLFPMEIFAALSLLYASAGYALRFFRKISDKQKTESEHS